MYKGQSKKKAKKFHKKLFKLSRIPINKLRNWFLGTRYILRRRFGISRVQAGFVLPTAIMVLLVLSLIVGSMLLRSVQRSEQLIGETKTQVIYNSATPAIDRARAKLEYLFEKDDRFPGGIPQKTS